MGSRVLCSRWLLPWAVFSFPVAQALVGLRKQFISNFVFPTWAWTAGFNNDNNNINNNNNNNNNNSTTSIEFELSLILQHLSSVHYNAIQMILQHLSSVHYNAVQMILQHLSSVHYNAVQMQILISSILRMDADALFDTSALVEVNVIHFIHFENGCGCFIWHIRCCWGECFTFHPFWEWMRMLKFGTSAFVEANVLPFIHFENGCGCFIWHIRSCWGECFTFHPFWEWMRMLYLAHPLLLRWMFYLFKSVKLFLSSLLKMSQQCKAERKWKHFINLKTPTPHNQHEEGGKRENSIAFAMVSVGWLVTSPCIL